MCVETLGHLPKAVGNIQDAKKEIAENFYHIAFVDFKISNDNGIDLIPVLLGAAPWLKIIIITAYASFDSAVKAIQNGAVDYLPKPFTAQQIEILLQRLSEQLIIENKINSLNNELANSTPDIIFETKNTKVLQVIELSKKVALSEATILLTGASGTGKSVIAKAIHEWSVRKTKPFSVISCPSLSAELLESELFGHVKGAFTGAISYNPGKISQCDGGVLFLDEIGDLPLQLQPKLLRFIQEREYENVGGHQTKKADLRIIAATNTDLKKAVEIGRFREDLYYRINVINIELPRLADRIEDIELLAGKMLFFFGKQNHKKISGFTNEALLVLKNYSYPGNLRELRNIIERATILCSSDKIGVEFLPDNLLPESEPPIKIGDSISLEKLQGEHIKLLLTSSKSIQEAATILGIDQATLWRKRKIYNI